MVKRKPVICIYNKGYDPQAHFYMVECTTCKQWYYPEYIDENIGNIENLIILIIV